MVIPVGFLVPQQKVLLLPHPLYQLDFPSFLRTGKAMLSPTVFFQPFSRSIPPPVPLPHRFPAYMIPICRFFHTMML